MPPPRHPAPRRPGRYVLEPRRFPQYQAELEKQSRFLCYAATALQVQPGS
jgi:hypothetical protein